MFVKGVHSKGAGCRRMGVTGPPQIGSATFAQGDSQELFEHGRGQAQSCFLIRMDSSSISEHAHEACSS